MRTKASLRGKTIRVPTHLPARLKDFILPDLAIRGDLRTALRQVEAAYQDACARTGETPLPLKFDLPPGNGPTLHLDLTSSSFSSSVKLLTALAGMQVTLEELTYRFEPLPDEGIATKTQVPAPPDLANRLEKMAGVGVSQDLEQTLAALGVTLDPTTRMELSSNGLLTVETDRPADAATISELIRTLGSERPFQMKFVAKTLELPAGTKWTAPNVSRMNDDEVQAMVRELAQMRGVDLMIIPSTTARNGEAAKIEIIRELLWEDSPGVFKQQPVGVVVDFKGNALGLGQDLDFHYSDTSGRIDPATAKPAITTHADIADTAFVSNGGTLFRVENRPDGSKRLLLMTAIKIDATGRPID